MKELSYVDPRISVPVKLRYDTYPEKHWFRPQAIEKLNNLEVLSPLTLLTEKVELYLNYKEGSENVSKTRVTLFEDSRTLKYAQSRKRLAKNSIDLIFTSPPYGTAQKYIRSSALSIELLGLSDNKGIAELDRMTIGSERLFFNTKESAIPLTSIRQADQLIAEVKEDNPRRAYLSACYLVEMRKFMEESCRVLKKGGRMAIVIGNNEVVVKWSRLRCE